MTYITKSDMLTVVWLERLINKMFFSIFGIILTFLKSRFACTLTVLIIVYTTFKRISKGEEWNYGYESVFQRKVYMCIYISFFRHSPRKESDIYLVKFRYRSIPKYKWIRKLTFLFLHFNPEMEIIKINKKIVWPF